MEDKCDIDVIYLDFINAFDQAPQLTLISKLEYVGITGNIINWIEDFLRERNQKVKVGRFYSSSAKVLSGIPQGSILGPILFSILINDLPNWVPSCCKIFADDTKLYDLASNHVQIQTDIDALQRWSDKRNLYFNTDKC